MGNLLQKLRKEVSVIYVSDKKVIIRVKQELTETQEVFFLIPRDISYSFINRVRAGDQFSYIGIEFSANEAEIRSGQATGVVAGKMTLRIRTNRGKIKELQTRDETQFPATLTCIKEVTFSKSSGRGQVTFKTPDSIMRMTESSPGIYTVGMF